MDSWVDSRRSQLGIHRGQSGSLLSAFGRPTRLESSVSLGTAVGCYYFHTSVSLTFSAVGICLLQVLVGNGRLLL